jgi:signal transduction histidine kinase
VEVQDQGPGIAADEQQKLFKKFSKLAARPTGGEDSTGLGLSIVKKLAEAMNGTVWYEDAVVLGSVFVVCLPVVNPH